MLDKTIGHAGIEEHVLSGILNIHKFYSDKLKMTIVCPGMKVVHGK